MAYIVFQHNRKNIKNIYEKLLLRVGRYKIVIISVEIDI